MLAVPEVDDDIDSSPSIETTSVTATLQQAIVSTPATSQLTITDNENTVASQTTNTTTPAATQQHRSRLSLFQRNTIHACDHNIEPS
jgi:hypothetical protein